MNVLTDNRWQAARLMGLVSDVNDQCERLTRNGPEPVYAEEKHGFAVIDDDTLTTMADRLAPITASRFRGDESAAPWLDVEGAAEHLACPCSRIYALVSARRIPHHKDGSRLLFRAEELDEWVRTGGGKRP